MPFRSTCECTIEGCLQPQEKPESFHPFPLYLPIHHCEVFSAQKIGSMPHFTAFRRWAFDPSENLLRFLATSQNIQKDSDGDQLAHYSVVPLSGFLMPPHSAAPGSTFYFEVEILEVPVSENLSMGGALQIGLCLPPLARQDIVGNNHQTPPLGYLPAEYGYHGDDGAFFVSSFRGRPHMGPQFSAGDVIGCGVLNNGQVYWTHHGLFIDVAGDPVAPDTILHAAVASSGSGLVRIRTQPPFRFEAPNAQQVLQWPFPLNTFALRMLLGVPAFCQEIARVTNLSALLVWQLLGRHPEVGPLVRDHLNPDTELLLAPTRRLFEGTVFKEKFLDFQHMAAMSNAPLAGAESQQSLHPSLPVYAQRLTDQFSTINQLQHDLQSAQIRLKGAMDELFSSLPPAQPSTSSSVSASASLSLSQPGLALQINPTPSRDILTASQEFLYEDREE